MIGGATVVVTLCKPENRNRNLDVKPDDEQFHVLSNYAPSDSLKNVGGLAIGKKLVYDLFHKKKYCFLLLFSQFFVFRRIIGDDEKQKLIFLHFLPFLKVSQCLQSILL